MFRSFPSFLINFTSSLFLFLFFVHHKVTKAQKHATTYNLHLTWAISVEMCLSTLAKEEHIIKCLSKYNKNCSIKPAQHCVTFEHCVGIWIECCSNNKRVTRHCNYSSTCTQLWAQHWIRNEQMKRTQPGFERVEPWYSLSISPEVVTKLCFSTLFNSSTRMVFTVQTW